jgi:hypothetical protein
MSIPSQVMSGCSAFFSLARRALDSIVSKQLSRIVVVGLSVICLLIGCTKAPSGPQRYPVSGKVTYNGKPVTSGLITFGTTGAQGGADFADVQKDGSYRVERGLANGEYFVVIQSYVRPPQEIPPPEFAKLGDANLAVPKKYTEPKTTDLKINVASNASTANFDLKD